MLKKILLILAIALVLLVLIIQRQPNTFTVTRSAVMNAPPQTVFEQVNDFRRWEAWSPWAKLDPNATNTFSGPESGEGASFSWSGDHNVGAGKQTIIESRPGELLRIRLEFVRPFAGTSETLLTFAKEGNGTRMTWTMSGENSFMGKAIGLIMDCDTKMGGYFEQGLANIKKQVEAPTQAATTSAP